MLRLATRRGMRAERTSEHLNRPRHHRLPVLVMLLLPAFIAEALSGATPPLMFFGQPNILVSFTLYYGSAAILARELTVRWRRGWPSVLLLGATFAIVQEGLGTKVFFDPTRTELSPLVNYGTDPAGVHWVFIVQLIIYHAVYSVTVPVLLVELMFRDRRGEPWVGNRMLWLAMLCIAVITWLLYLIYSYTPPPGPYITATVAAIIVFVLARRVPCKLAASGSAQAWAPSGYFLLGLTAGALFFLVSFGAPSANVPPLLTALALPGIAAVGGRIVARHSTSPSWAARHELGLAAGLLAPLILLAFFQESRGRGGSSLVGLATAGLLFWLWRRLSNARAAPADVWQESREVSRR
jgi:hypothetical protein